MKNARKISADSVNQNDLNQIDTEITRNHIKARYLNLVSQISSSFDGKTNNEKNNHSIQFRNDKATLIAADLALQYLQRRNMSLTLETASSESRNLLIRHFEDRWLARTLQIRGRQEVLNGLILSKKNNTFDIGFGPNFIKNQKEDEEKKYKSNAFRSKSLPSENNKLLSTLKELKEEKQTEITNDKSDSMQKTEKHVNDSETQIRSKSSKSSNAKKSRRSYQDQKTNHIPEKEDNEQQLYSSQINNSESQHCSPKINNSESQQYSPQENRSGSQQYSEQINNSKSKQYSSQIYQIEYSSNKKSDKPEAKDNKEPDFQNESHPQSQSQKTSNGSENKSSNINENTTTSNMLPSPLKTTYSGRENENENEDAIEKDIEYKFGANDEIKTHTYEYSTIYSEDEPTHETIYEYETLTQLTDCDDYNSKTSDYSSAINASSQQLCKEINENELNLKTRKNKNNTESASTSPKINPSTTYEYYPSYSIKDGYEYSNYQKKTEQPASKKKQQQDLQLEFPFVQSRNANVTPNDGSNQNSREQPEPKHEDYYSRKHSKRPNDKLIFSNPVEFSNPAILIDSFEEDKEVHISTVKREAAINQTNQEIAIEEEEEEVKNEPINNFFIFHAVDIEPDYELQKIFKSQAKNIANKMHNEMGNLLQKRNKDDQSFNSLQKELHSNKKSAENPSLTTKYNKKNQFQDIEEREISLINEDNKNINLSGIEKGKHERDASSCELFDQIESISKNKREKTNTESKKNQDDNNDKISTASSYVSILSSEIKKTKHHHHFHKHQHHGSIRKENQLINNAKYRFRNINRINDNNNVNERGVQLDNGIKSKKNKINNDFDNFSSSGVSSLVVPPSSSSPASFFSSENQKLNNNSFVTDDNIVIQNENTFDQNRKTKFSHKLESSKIDNKKKLYRQSSTSSIPITNNKNASSSMESIPLDIKISGTSTFTSFAKICESISEDELLEMSDASPASFD